MIDDIEEEILPGRKTLVAKPHRAVINNLCTGIESNQFLKKEVHKLHQKQVREAESRDQKYRQNQLWDLRKRLVKYSQKINTSDALCFQRQQKSQPIRAPVVQNVNYWGKYNIKMALKAHTVSQLNSMDRQRQLKDNWNRSKQSVFNSPNYKKMNHFLRLTDENQTAAFLRNSQAFQFPKHPNVRTKPKSAYGPRPKNWTLSSFSKQA